jgi:hypothetical protein
MMGVPGRRPLVEQHGVGAVHRSHITESPQGGFGDLSVGEVADARDHVDDRFRGHTRDRRRADMMDTAHQPTVQRRPDCRAFSDEHLRPPRIRWYNHRCHQSSMRGQRTWHAACGRRSWSRRRSALCKARVVRAKLQLAAGDGGLSSRGAKSPCRWTSHHRSPSRR